MLKHARRLTGSGDIHGRYTEDALPNEFENVREAMCCILICWAIENRFQTERNCAFAEEEDMDGWSTSEPAKLHII